MDHRRLSLQFLMTTGLIPVRVRPKQKDPFNDWDPRRAASEDKSLILAYLDANPDVNIGALFSGKFVDLDVDNDNDLLEEALDYFLPRTPYIWGRASKPRSHRVFTLSEDFDRSIYSRFLRNLKRLGEGTVNDSSYSLELRGGRPEAGLFSVLPGSVHPSGEAYEWVEGADPTVGAPFVTVHSLVRSLRLAVVASILARYWVEGSRNDISLAFAGLLWRIRHTTMSAFGFDNEDEAPLDIFILTMDDAQAVFKCIMQISGDAKDDERSRLLNLINTWKKLDSDASAKASGGKVLAELIGSIEGEKVVKAMYDLLSDTEGAEELEKLAEQYVIWYGPGVLIDLNLVRLSRAKSWMTKDQATNSMGAKKVRVGDNYVKVVNMLFGSSIAQRVYGLTFDPRSDEILVESPEGTKVNQWRGFAMQPASQSVLPEQVQPLLDYIRCVVSNNDPKAYEWIMAWIADLFQYPGDKPGTALVLIGAHGAGKSFLGEHVIGPIIGPHHYGQVGDVGKLTEKFNANLDNKVFIQCDETVHSYQKDVASKLKALITSPSLVVEPKGIDSFEKPNHIRLLFTSNEDTSSIFIDPSPYERRFTVVTVSHERAKDIIYWESMHEWIKINREKILRYFLDYKYDRKLVMRPYVTEAKRDIQRVGVDAEVSWMLTRLNEGFLISIPVHKHWFSAYNTEDISDADKMSNTLKRELWPNRVQMTALEDDFKEYLRRQGRTVYSGSVITSIRKVFPPASLKKGEEFIGSYYDRQNERKVQMRVRTMAVPSADEIREYLRGVYGSIVDEIDYEPISGDLKPPYDTGEF